jgi:FKBP-type peptidyl-prolyl cis-trans isomerase
MYRINFINVALFFVVTVLSCNSSNEYPGFTKTDSGIFFKLHKLGEDPRSPSAGDYITADIKYKTMNDSVFFSGRRKVQVQQPAYQGAIDECFMMMKVGEEATFIIEADSFFRNTLNSSSPTFMQPNAKMKITVSIIDMQSQREYENEKTAFLKWIDDFDAFEKEMLKQFIQKEQFNVVPSGSGLYKLVMVKGEGRTVEVGDTVVVHYEGRFLNGRFFDSTKKRKEAFGFVYGTEWQVVEGLEKAIGTMREGEKALFVLPSDLAFGSDGSSTGIIPPYTSVMFEVELLSVN